MSSRPISDKPYCDFVGCDKRPTHKAQLQWTHYCGKQGCDGDGKGQEFFNFPYWFCKEHLPTPSELYKSPLFEEIRKKMKEMGRTAPSESQVATAYYNVFEESVDLH